MSGKDESAVEQDRLLEALADAQRRIDGLQRTIALSQRDRARTQEELMRAYASLADARNEIEGIHRSRLWRLAAAYWRIRQLLR
ncbi:MAG TPA: hypothetical protein VFL12_08495, partial [Thermoanaerobaculia bacterium]|nr:hypothetical protein [Thermoanaerobaculia bacterium]